MLTKLDKRVMKMLLELAEEHDEETRRDCEEHERLDFCDEGGQCEWVYTGCVRITYFVTCKKCGANAYYDVEYVHLNDDDPYEGDTADLEGY